jgi:hypothetical protein
MRPAGAWTKEEEEAARAAVHGLKPVARKQLPLTGRKEKPLKRRASSFSVCSVPSVVNAFAFQPGTWNLEL